jgi:hypothetical protein
MFKGVRTEYYSHRGEIPLQANEYVIVEADRVARAVATTRTMARSPLPLARCFDGRRPPTWSAG